MGLGRSNCEYTLAISSCVKIQFHVSTRALWDLLQGLKETEKAQQRFFSPPGSAPASPMSSEQEGAAKMLWLTEARSCRFALGLREAEHQGMVLRVLSQSTRKE